MRAPVILTLLQPLLMGWVQGQDEFCRCIGTLPASIPKQACSEPYAVNGECVDATVSGSTVQYPSTYGEYCDAHKEPGESDCWNLDDNTEKTTDRAAWCRHPWCYVDNCTGYTVVASDRFPGEDLEYSYEFCQTRVEGSMEIVFTAGVICSTATTDALKDALAKAFTAITERVYVAGDIDDIHVAACGRRLTEGRRLDPATTTIVTYVLLETSAAFAQGSITAAKSLTSSFTSAFQATMTAYSIATSVLAVATPASSRLSDFFTSLPVPLLSASASALAGVKAPRWRLVGREASSEWKVRHVVFYEDVACSRVIPSIPKRALRRYNGNAFGGPNRRNRRDHSAADAFEDTSVFWHSTAPCGITSDDCHIGFDWISNQVDSAACQISERAENCRSTGLPTRMTVGPQCIMLEQADSPWSAKTILVQYKLDGDTWRTHTVAAGLLGGSIRIRIPIVALF